MDIINQIKALAAENPSIEVLWLYGSRVKGRANAESDYDLAVAQTNIPENPIERADIADELAYSWREKLALPEKQLSIVDINSVPITLAYSIMQNHQVLYCINPLRRIREENRIDGLMGDYRHLKGI